MKIEVKAALQYAQKLGHNSTIKPYRHLITLADALRESRAREKRLREALEFYADTQNWERDDWGITRVIDEPPDMNDAGATARAALAETEEGDD